MTSRVGGTVPGGDVDLVDVEPLEIADCYELIEQLSAGDLAPEQRDDIVARSDRVPLYVEELVRGVAQSPSDTATTVRGPRATATVPEALYEPLVARLYATEGGVPVATAAATIGRDVDLAVLEQVVDLPPRALGEALAALARGRILEPAPGASTRWQFRHQLLRDVAYDLQPPSRRATMHGRVADAMRSERGEDAIVDWPVVAAHYDVAGRGRDAATAYERAAEESRQRGALGEARGHLGRAIELVAALPDDDDRRRWEVHLRLRRGVLAVSAEGNSSPEAAADYGRSLELAVSTTGDEELFTTLVPMWAYYTSRAELGRARQVLDTYRSTLLEGRDLFVSTNHAGYGMIEWFEGDFRRALETLEAAFDTFARGREDDVVAVWYLPNDPIAAMHTHLALARFMRGDTAGAEEQFAATEHRTAGLDFPAGPFSAAYGLALEAWTWLERGEIDRAEEVVERVAALAERHGFDSWMLVAATERATVAALRALSRGDVPAAELRGHADTVAAFVSAWQAADVRIFLPFYLSTVGALLAVAGDVDGARGRFDEALALAAATGMRFYDAETRRRRASVASDPAVVESSLCEALELARRQGAVVFEERIERDLDQRPAGP
ncbi:MAG: hypothetical protein ACRD0G_03405 [Acidimicrobiales bacterium]